MLAGRLRAAGLHGQEEQAEPGRTAADEPDRRDRCGARANHSSQERRRGTLRLEIEVLPLRRQGYYAGFSA
jgi:hypothetical protein